MADQTIKTQVRALLQTGLEEQRVLIAGLSDEQRSQVGTAEQWNAKNLISHIAAGHAELVAAMQAMLRGEQPDETFNESDADRNRAVFEERQAWPWPKVSAAAEESFAGLLALLDTFSDTDLTAPDYFPKPLNRSLWRIFVDYGYWHPVGHYADYYLEHGDLARATALQQKIAKDTASLGNDEARGIADYNLACFYAKTGQKSQALELLPGALKLAPRLVEWSKEDKDLISLHNELEYQALYT